MGNTKSKVRELFYDDKGVLLTQAAYEQTVQGRLQVLHDELDMLTVIIQQLRAQLDNHVPVTAMTDEEYDDYEAARMAHGLTYSNIIHCKKLMLKWAYQV